MPRRPRQRERFLAVAVPVERPDADFFAVDFFAVDVFVPDFAVFFADDVRAAVLPLFFAAPFFAALFFAALFLAAPFFAVAFFAALLRLALFFAVPFFAALLLAAPFFAVAFFAALFFAVLRVPALLAARVVAAFFAAAERVPAPFVFAAFFAAAERLDAERLAAALRACFDSDFFDAAECPSRLSALVVARERLAEVLLLFLLAARSWVAFLRVLLDAPFFGGGRSTPSRRASDRPIAMACLLLRAPCLPSRT